MTKMTEEESCKQTRVLKKNCFLLDIIDVNLHISYNTKKISYERENIIIYIYIYTNSIFILIVYTYK